MTFEELMTKVRDLASKTDASGRDFLAVQVNIAGKEGGAVDEMDELLED